MTLLLEVRAESFALRAPFRISRGEKTHAEVVVVQLRDGERTALAEAVPYARYGEDIAGVVATLAALAGRERSEGELAGCAATLRGAAQNALATALFALEQPARCRDALGDFRVEDGASTIVLDTRERMADAARAFRASTMKVKLLGDSSDLARLRAVRAARPELPIWIDANEGCTVETFEELAPHLGELGVALFEQPFPSALEPQIIRLCPLVPLCADESFHDQHDVARVKALGYRAVNVKLDKAGGLPGALRAAEAAHCAGLVIAVGCMVSSSLSIAAAWTLVKLLRERGIPVPFVDLDGATFLTVDRPLDTTVWGDRSGQEGSRASTSEETPSGAADPSSS